MKISGLKALWLGSVIAGSMVVVGGCSASEKKVETTSKSASPVKEAPSAEYKPAPVETTRLALTQLPLKYAALKNAVQVGRSAAIQDEGSKLLSENPNDPIALNALSMMHLRAGRPLAAKLFLQRALEKNPPSAALLNNLAVLLYKSDELHLAYGSFRKAASTELDHAKSTANLVTIQLEAGDTTRSSKALAGTYDANQLDQRLSQLQAIQYRLLGKYSDARSVYERLIKTDARDTVAMINYAILLIDFMNQPKEGLVLLSKIRFIETERRDILKQVEALEMKARKTGS